MIVTISDYPGAADYKAGPINNEQITDEEDDSKFTVTRAGYLKIKLQALNRVLTRTPLDQHGQLRFNDIVQGDPPRTYVNGSEDVYFLVKDLPWPSKIPEVFANAYAEVVQSRPFTNKYIPRPFKCGALAASASVSARFAPTFSRIRPLLNAIDALCDTMLSNLFERAHEKVKSFAFMRLPSELRLQVYDYLVPPEPFVLVHTRKALRLEQRLPTQLDVVRVSRALHWETTEHFFNGRTLLFEACKLPNPFLSRSWKRGCFTMHSAAEFTSLLTGITEEIRRKFTRLEVTIVSEGSSMDEMEEHISLHDRIDATPLRQICAALPNLQVVILSFPKRPFRMLSEDGSQSRGTKMSFLRGQKITLDWICAQLPNNGARIAWDLTYFRQVFGDAPQWKGETGCKPVGVEYLRNEIMSERKMRELIERNGTLDLAQSATITADDLQRWSDMKEIVLKALEK